ncbi:restriction endonuclease subunit S, partial [uncultured Campylobacter sp.]|uniref:restriction endonuclease subunit S n=1 Tax=uncultured Campylobacter sp. TaxID=218934 RepID=UPI0025EAC034
MTNIWRFVSMYDGQQGGYKLDDIKNHKIQLPITASGEIDFEFMESFVAELEAYLAAASLKDYKLTADELSALSKFENYNWGEFRLGDLFEVNSSKKIFHANTLENIYNEQISNSLPYVVRTTKNNGIVGYINENQIYANEANTLSFAQDTFTVFYQKQKYFTGNKVKVLKSKFDLKNSNVMHFLVACFQKVLANLSWGDGSTVTSIKQIKIQLPINKNGEIDFEFMNNFIKAIKKLVIKDVVLYTDNKIKATKSIVSSNQ